MAHRLWPQEKAYVFYTHTGEGPKLWAGQTNLLSEPRGINIAEEKACNDLLRGILGHPQEMQKPSPEQAREVYTREVCEGTAIRYTGKYWGNT